MLRVATHNHRFGILVVDIKDDGLVLKDLQNWLHAQLISSGHQSVSLSQPNYAYIYPALLEFRSSDTRDGGGKVTERGTWEPVPDLDTLVVVWAGPWSEQREVKGLLVVESKAGVQAFIYNAKNARRYTPPFVALNENDLPERDFFASAMAHLGDELIGAVDTHNSARLRWG